MAETLFRTSPVESHHERFAALAPAVSLREEPFVAMVNLWSDAGGPAAAQAASVLGFDLPTAPLTSTGDSAMTAVWMGPEESLVIGGNLSGVELAAALGDATREHGGVAVDVSTQRTTLRLGGPHARDVLSKGCSVDLHPREFAAHAAVQTMLGLAAVVLIAPDDAGDYRILVRASFARYLADWLIDAAEEYTAEPSSAA